MEILQGAVNREDFYSVKECAEILGVTTRTIRNRIERKELSAFWNEIGKGQSQWLIPKKDIAAIVDKEVSAVRDVSLPNRVLIEEIKARFAEENSFLRAENAALREEIRAVRESQGRIEKLLIQSLEKPVEMVETPVKPWWKVWK